MTWPDRRPGVMIHIGSPKTGTTAIQNHLKLHGADAPGLSFVVAGRSNISHNRMVRPLIRGTAAQTVHAVRAEIEAHPASLHVLSSEMLFAPAAAEPMARALDGLGPVRVCAWLRRPDRFIEAMYKQKVKNGRIAADPEAFLAARQSLLFYGPVLDAWATAFGHEALTVRHFAPATFPEKSVVSDFLAVCGIPSCRIPQRHARANRTLSRAISEALGQVARTTDLDTRRMQREIAASGSADVTKSADVFTRKERLGILALAREDLDHVERTYLPGPFRLDDLAEDAPDRFPNAAETARLERSARTAVLDAVARQLAERRSDVAA